MTHDDIAKAKKDKERTKMNIKRLKQASLSDKQTWESKWKTDSLQAIAVHKTVTNVILTDMQPLSIVEDEGFVRLIRQNWPKKGESIRPKLRLR